MDPRVKTTDDVILAAPVIIREGCIPCRMVLRNLEYDKEYVTHRELLIQTATGFEHKGFEDGRYFSYREFSSSEEQLTLATEDFTNRARNQ